jgi:hypothetical protein
MIISLVKMEKATVPIGLSSFFRGDDIAPAA